MRLLQLAAGEIPARGVTEIAAIALQQAITLGLTWTCAVLHREYRKPVYAWWTLAWMLYVFRLGAILVFLLTERWLALYWHQVLTGWVALAMVATATAFTRPFRLRRWHAALAAFPAVWSYVAIYEMDEFGWAAGPAVVFLSAATLWTGVTFLGYARKVGSLGASLLATAFLLWGLHHLDYPFLRAKGAWVPWGYYLDVLFQLAVGAGILLLVADDLRRGLGALTALSAETQGPAPRARGPLLDALLARPLTLPAVRGCAFYAGDTGRFERGSGSCASWAGAAPTGAEAHVLADALATGRPHTCAGWRAPDATAVAPYAAVLPVGEGGAPAGALVIVGDARDPFAALDDAFLTALGQQIGAALANAALTERLAQRTAELERLSARMVRQHEDERRRLSRELHDETAQVLAALKLELGTLKAELPPAQQARVDDAEALVDAGIRGIRAVTDDLRPSLLDDLGLEPALRSLATAFGARGDLTVQYTPPGGPVPPLDPEAELAVYRALQEGLANVARHAAASVADVRLAADPSGVTLTIADDGRGFAPGEDGATSMGLTGMRERVAAVGGTVEIASAPASGSRLTVRVPARP